MKFYLFFALIYTANTFAGDRLSQQEVNDILVAAGIVLDETAHTRTTTTVDDINDAIRVARLMHESLSTTPPMALPIRRGLLAPRKLIFQ